jgi:hypothetical protein
MCLAKACPWGALPASSPQVNALVARQVASRTVFRTLPGSGAAAFLTLARQSLGSKGSDLTVSSEVLNRHLPTSRRKRWCSRLQAQVRENLLNRRSARARRPWRELGTNGPQDHNVSELTSRIAAMTLSSPPQFGQCSRSKLKTRFKSLAQPRHIGRP